MSGDVRCSRATLEDASVLAKFLVAQDVRPAPTAPDIEALVSQSDAALFVARRDRAIVGTAACTKDGASLQLSHFVVAGTHFALAEPPSAAAEVARQLLSCIESYARRLECAVLLGQVDLNSQAHRLLVMLGFSVDYEEPEIRGTRVVPQLDLLKRLAP